MQKPDRYINLYPWDGEEHQTKAENAAAHSKKRRIGWATALFSLSLLLGAALVFYFWPIFPEVYASILQAVPEATLSPTLPETAPSVAPTDPSEIAAVSLRYQCGCQIDMEKLLQMPLELDRSQSGPQVLILHTHATESYTRSSDEKYAELEKYRTLDENYNAVSIGSQLAALLEAAGISVIHDTTVYDYPSYNDAYDNARLAIAETLAEYPSIQLVLDLHRDAVENEDGSQWAPTVTINGQTAARITFVVGTGCEADNQPHWEQNMAVTMQLQALLEQQYPGLYRQTTLTGWQYNQDLLPGSLLVEVGTAGNTHREALTAAEALADGVLALLTG